MMRAGLIGCGRIGCEFDSDAERIGIYTHAAAWRAAEGVELYAIADPDPAKLANCGERYAIPLERRYTDPAAMLATEMLQLVSIAAPDRFHAGLAEQALSTPGMRGVLLEKPLALSVEEGARLVEQAAARRIALAVNYSRRYCPAHERVRAALSSGSLGRIQQVGGFYGKGIRHNGSHWLDLLRHLLGPLAALQAWSGAAADFEGDPSPDLRIRTAQGVQASLLACDHQAFSLFEMDIVAERGRIRILESGHRIEWYEVADSPYYSGYRLPVLREQDGSGMRDLLLAAVADLRDAVHTGRQPRCNGQDGLAALQAAEAAVRSLASGRQEPLP
ncbi:Gfo/Idh/MocA family oxidoreductase [Chitinimonas arctica]|uniref:Gfo/Idh/MocA family oxidoreductase n=1 Tax=Chitinimonas arctica TaxID=2594795 RepID=A0A516SL82_9NEIS|nr:Gfo/Idh/MocA family oxidoreductase [Chitinimonas arctica]QDQ28906.1 Gfo/Idh/MocA family oxidoreductase [Chitinimonas arctica]